MKCTKHDVETSLRCGKCDRPICPKCTVFGPAGARCTECSSIRNNPLYVLDGTPRYRVYSIAMVTAIACGFTLTFFIGWGLFMLWPGLLAGYAVAEVVLRVSGRKRGPKVERLTGICAGGGMLLGFALNCLVRGLAVNPVEIAQQLVANPIYLIAVSIGVFMAVSRIRHI